MRRLSLVGLALLIVLPGTASGERAPEGNPLTVSHIERLPAAEGWPADGDEVVWRAWIENWTSEDREIAFRFLLDDREIARGTGIVPASDAAFFDLRSAWSFERKRLTFKLLPRGVQPRSPQTLTVLTDALAAGFYVEESVEQYFRLAQPLLGQGSSSFAEWAQRQIDRLNQLFAEAVYPETPDGVLDRVRLDKIIRVEDGALPLDGGPRSAAADRPDGRERRFDLQRGFPAEVIRSQYQNPMPGSPFDIDGALLHELGHARDLIDVYGYNVYHGVRGSRVDVREGDKLVAGSPFLPGKPAEHGDETGLLLFRSPEKGLMHYEYGFLDRYSAIALNRIAGERARFGGYNGSPSIGFFLDDLPERNILILRDSAGQPLAGATLTVYQDRGDPTSLYGKLFDNEPDLVRTADAAGRVDVGRNPFRSDGPIRFAKGEFRGVALLRVEHEERVGYTFLEARRFHLAYWRGQVDEAVHAVDFDRLIAVDPSED